MGRWKVEGVVSKVARHYRILRFSRQVRPAHVTATFGTGLPDVGTSRGPLLKTPTGHPQGFEAEEAVDQAHAAPAVGAGPARFVPQRLVDKSELQGQGHGLIIVKEVRAALGGRPEAFGRADLV